MEKEKHIDLFSFYGIDLIKKEDYSQTIELYDVLPKYVYGGVKRIEGKFLHNIERAFVFRNKKFNINISPALIRNRNGIEKAYYLGEREELVEDALRKIAIDKGSAVIDDSVGVYFSLYEVEQELSKRGHGYNKNQIKEAIQILHNSSIKIESEDRNDQFDFHPIDVYAFSKRGSKDRSFVKFNVLVNKSIKENTNRLFNYKQCMSLKYSLSRWLLKRISHHYTQGTANNPYTIMLTTIIRDSSISAYKRLPDNKRHVEKILKEMTASNIIINYKEEIILNNKRKNKIEDIKYFLYLSEEFCEDIKKGNFYQNKKIEGKKTHAISSGSISAVFVEKTELKSKFIEQGVSEDLAISIIAKIKDNKKEQETLASLEAVKEAINIYKEKGQKYNADRLIKTAIKEKWKSNNVVNSQEEIKEISEYFGKSYNTENQEKYNKFLNKLLSKVGEGDFKTWFKNIDLISVKEEQIKFFCKNKFVANHIEAHFEESLQECSKEYFGVDQAIISFEKKKVA